MCLNVPLSLFKHSLDLTYNGGAAACNLIVQQLGMHSRQDDSPAAHELRPPQPSSPFGDLHIGGDPINMIHPTADSEDELLHAYPL